MNERVYSKTKSLNERVSRSKRQNFFSQEQNGGVAENLKGKAEGMELNAMVAVVELVDSSGALKLEDIRQHRVTPECLSILNAKGTFRKSRKSKLLQKLTATALLNLKYMHVHLSLTCISFGVLRDQY